MSSEALLSRIDMKITVEFFKSLLLMVGYRGVRSLKNGYWEGRDSYGKQHRKAGEKYKKNSNICQALISGFSKKRVH